MTWPSFLPFVLGALAGLIVIGIGVAGWLDKRRNEAIATIAGRLGLSFSPSRDSELSRRHESRRGLHEGGSRYADKVLLGLYRGHSVTAFDLHHETSSTEGHLAFAAAGRERLPGYLFAA